MNLNWRAGNGLKIGVLKRCVSTKQVFACNVRIGRLVRDGRIEDARRVFDEMVDRDVVSWNAMVAGYWRNGSLEESKRVFKMMPERNVISWNSMVAGCVEHGKIGEACGYFRSMPYRNVASWNAMISGFVRYGMIGEAARLFEAMPKKNVISYTAMVDGYVKDEQLERAREIFEKMQTKNEVSWVVMISAYVDNDMFDEAKKLFDEMPTKGIMAITTMITGYCKEGKLDYAKYLFRMIVRKDLPSWNAIISGHAQNGLGEEALYLQNQMRGKGIKSDHVTFIAVLTACCIIASLRQGKQVHSSILKSGFALDASISNALVTMYSKCGSLEDAESVFDLMICPDFVSWNAMVAACGQHGCYDKALSLFWEMEKSGVKPDGATFLSILSACGHVGKVKESLNLFESMVEQHAVERKPEHYSCMVDILGRSGKLEKAFQLVEEMPFDADVAVWGALLRACGAHLNVELGELAATKNFELEPCNSGAYIMLSNIYAAVGMWHEVTRMRMLVKENGIRKQPGYTWMEMGDKVHVFLGGDISHPEIGNVHLVLRKIGSHMIEDEEHISLIDY